MKRRILRSVSPLFLLTVMLPVTGLAVFLTQQRGTAKTPVVSQSKQRTLRELARERDVVRESAALPQFSTFDELVELPHAIVYGRITDSVSFFGESDHPLEDGDYITTEYTVEVSRVLKSTRLNTPLAAGQPEPAPLITPLKISRNGGVVRTNGRRAEVRVKGYESLKPGQDYVFFLFWSTDYKSYILAGDMSGAVIINEDLSLRPLASSEEIRKRFQGADIESLAAAISRRD
ncbi:MAG TPA: hypothetical protein VFS10_14685 [Pyrinomonadaceae bacterium]|nr:hypothetical protein [Pyrinomonadaceae bacterium]